MWIVGDSQRSFDDGSERCVTRITEYLTIKLKRSEIRCKSVFRDASMWREPPPRQRHVALAGVDVDVAASVFTVAVDGVFPGNASSSSSASYGRNPSV